MRRFLLLSAFAVVLTPVIMWAGTGAPAEYVGGTVKSIPANTNGALDASNGPDLLFKYGKTVFSVPYQKITDTQITEPDGHHLWKVPVPKIIGRGERLLNITYRDGDNTRMLTFKGSASSFKEIVDTIDGHRKDTQPVAAFTARPPAKPVVEDWWGDKYWRTTRNKAKWPQIPQDNAPGVPGGSKE